MAPPTSLAVARLKCVAIKTQRFYENISAPQKDVVLLERAGHDPNQDVVDAQFKFHNERILPLTKYRTKKEEQLLPLLSWMRFTRSRGNESITA